MIILLLFFIAGVLAILATCRIEPSFTEVFIKSRLTEKIAYLIAFSLFAIPIWYILIKEEIKNG